MQNVQRVLIQDSDGKTVADFNLEERGQRQLTINFICSFYLMWGASSSEDLPAPSTPLTSKNLAGEQTSAELFTVTAAHQVGKKEVIRWGKTGITGNLVATMQALHTLLASGAEYNEPKDLSPFIQNNARYGLEVAPHSLRNQLRWLKERELVSDDNRLMPVAEEMAQSVEVIEKSGSEELPEGFGETEKVEDTD